MSENLLRHFIASGWWIELEAELYEVKQTLGHVFTKPVNGIRKIKGFESEDTANFIDHKAIERDHNEIDKQGEEQPDVLYYGTTQSSNKKRRLECYAIPVPSDNSITFVQIIFFHNFSKECRSRSVWENLKRVKNTELQLDWIELQILFPSTWS